MSLPELEQARVAILNRRAALEAEKSEIGGRLNGLQAERARIKDAISAANRRRAGVGGLHDERAAVERDLADTREQLAGVETDLALTWQDSATLAERFRPALLEIAKAASRAEAGALATLVAAFDDWAAAHDQAVTEWVQVFGPPSAGIDAHLRQDPSVAGLPAGAGFDARIPGGAPTDTVAIDTPPLGFGFVGGRAGTRWRPRELLTDVIGQLRGRDCMPAAVVRDPRAGQPGVYVSNLDGNERKLDERALRAGARDEVTGELSAWRFKRELNADDAYSLELTRADQARWAEGKPPSEPVKLDIGDPMATEQPSSEPIPDADHLATGDFTERDGRFYWRTPDGREVEVEE